MHYYFINGDILSVSMALALLSNVAMKLASYLISLLAGLQTRGMYSI